MRIKTSNALVQINANMKRGEFDKALAVAEQMVTDSDGSLVIVEADPCEGYIVMSAVWGNFQAEEWRNLYEVAKGAL